MTASKPIGFSKETSEAQTRTHQRQSYTTTSSRTLSVIEMPERNKVRITVLRRFDQFEVFKKSPVEQTAPFKACEDFRDGQEFIVDEDMAMPEGFCTYAWNTIFGDVKTLAFGGNFPCMPKRESP